MKKEVKVKSLKSYHGIVAALSFITLVFVVFTNDWSDWLTYLPIFVAICFDGKFEKNDELAKQNLAKANAAAMWTLIAALAVLYMDGRSHDIPAYYYLIAISGVLALRSGLFLILDRTPKNAEEEE